jgi:hypothetical protein
MYLTASYLQPISEKFKKLHFLLGKVITPLSCRLRSECLKAFSSENLEDHK